MVAAKPRRSKPQRTKRHKLENTQSQLVANKLYDEVKALSKINSPRQVAARRGKKVNEVISQRVNDGEVSA